MLFSIVIPCYPGHFKYVNNILSQIHSFYMTKEFDIHEIIFAVSGTSEEYFRKLIKIDTKYPIVVHATPDECWAARNRNRGWEMVTVEWIIFLDIDDVYHPDKLYVTHQAILRFPDIDCVLHTWVGPTYKNFESLTYRDPELIHVTGNDVIYNLTPKNGVYTSVTVPAYRYPGAPRHGLIHHGIATVRANSKLRYDEAMQRGEDCKFCNQQSLEGKIIVIDANLMIYGNGKWIKY